MDIQKLQKKWRGRDDKPQPKRLVQLRNQQEQPAEPEEIGSVCMACEELTEEIQCIQGDYWVCPACAKRHQALAEYAQRCAEFRKAEFEE